MPPHLPLQNASTDTINRCIRESLDALEPIRAMNPRIALITGTGLANLVPQTAERIIMAYSEIPHFPVSTVQSHSGRLVCTRLDDIPLLIMEGRCHLYEGYDPATVTFPIRIMKALGIETLLLSNAAGGIDTSLCPGDILLIRDHINLTGENALVGPHDPAWGDRFPDMSEAYSKRLRALAAQIAADRNISCREGVYVGLKGPSLETPAEIRFLRAIGADAVGFSTVQEVIVANQCNIDVLGLSVITNVHRPENPIASSLAEIVEIAGRTSQRLQELITAMVPIIAGRKT